MPTRKRKVAPAPKVVREDVGTEDYSPPPWDGVSVIMLPTYVMYQSAKVMRDAWIRCFMPWL